MINLFVVRTYLLLALACTLDKEVCFVYASDRTLVLMHGRNTQVKYLWVSISASWSYINGLCIEVVCAEYQFVESRFLLGKFAGDLSSSLLMVVEPLWRNLRRGSQHSM